MELGRDEVAARWIDEAVEKATGPSTRYRFTRGLLQWKRGQLDQVLETARQMREQGSEESNGKSTEEKAAAFLEGRVALSRGDAEAAIERFEESVRLEGYPYALYDAGLAEALAAAGDLARAEEVVKRAVSYRDPSEVRLDLELPRARAQLLLASILAERGDLESARSVARAYLDRLGSTASRSEHPDVRRARELLGESRP
ncbi:MAG TPA: tetratricopeptide repeat protein, partial [Vicinamibacteria bacterium]